MNARGLVGIPEFSATNRNGNVTGGKAFYNTNDIKSAVRQAIDDSRVTCAIGYHPAHGQWDGEWREIKIRVRRPRVNLSYRHGYHAIPDQPVTDRGRQTALQEAVRSTLETASIGITVHLRPMSEPKPEKPRFILGIDPRNVNLEEKDGRWVGQLDLLFVPDGGTGEKASAVHDTLDLKLAPELYRATMQKGTILAKDVVRSEGAAQLRLVVRDAATGAVGSVNIATKDVTARGAAAPPARCRRAIVGQHWTRSGDGGASRRGAAGC